VLQCVAACCSVLHAHTFPRKATQALSRSRCSVLQCVAVLCGMLQCGAACFSVFQRVAACCTQTVSRKATKALSRSQHNGLRFVALFRSALQCIIVCCSVLHTRTVSRKATKALSKSRCIHSRDICLSKFSKSQRCLLHGTFSSEPTFREFFVQGHVASTRKRSV